MHYRRRHRTFKHQKAVPKPAFPQEPTSPIIQDAPIFGPKLRDVLVMVVNKLDPSSFVKFARTCKDMHNFCFTTKGIDVQYGKQNNEHKWDMTKYHTLMIESAGPSENQTRFKFYKNQDRIWSGKRLRMKLQTMPFTFTIQDLIIAKAVNDRFLIETEEYLGRFPRIRIDSVVLFDRLQNLHGFYEFMMKYHVDTLDIRTLRPGGTPHHLDDILFFMKNLSSFDYNGFVPDEDILDATTKNLELPAARISRQHFKRLLQKFVDGEILYWSIGHSGDIDEFHNALSEMKNTEEVENLQTTELKPSVIYYSVLNKYPPRSIYGLLKSDGSAGYFEIRHNCVEFNVNP